MSFVAPRPFEVTEDAGYGASIPGYGRRCRMKPGLTGPGRTDSHGHRDLEIKLDLEYVEQPFRWRSDLRHLARTVRHIVRG